MSEHPLVPIIRWWLACLALCGLTLIWPECSLLLIGGGFGWWPGCGCCGGLACSCCSAGARERYQIDLSGFTNGSCTSCATYNSSFIVSATSLPDPVNAIYTCNWQIYPISGTTCSDCKEVLLGIDRSFGTVRITVQIRVPAIVGLFPCNTFGLAEMVTWRDTGISPDPDCNTFASRPIPWSGDLGDPCTFDHSPALVTAL